MITYWRWILLCVYCLMRSTEAGCSVQNFTDDFGTASCSKKDNQNFDWLFKPPDDKQDVLFVVKLMQHFGKGNQSQQEIHLPTGFASLPLRNCWNKETPWCEVYAKAETNTKRPCNMNARVNGICNTSIVPVSQWPPRIRGNLTDFSVIFLYEYLDCAELAAFSNKNVSELKSSSWIIATICLAILLLLVVIIVLAVLCKYRTLSQLRGKHSIPMDDAPSYFMASDVNRECVPAGNAPSENCYDTLYAVTGSGPAANGQNTAANGQEPDASVVYSQVVKDQNSVQQPEHSVASKEI